MMTTRAGLAVAFALLFGISSTALAQRGRQGGAGEKPKVDVVQSVGCAERRTGNQETWWLARASDPTVAQAGIFSTPQVEAAKNVRLGANSFQLIGVADFLDTEGLLRSGQRREFTTHETANATGQLREGRKVLVKGLLIDGDVKRVNLLAVIALSDSCG